jgi:hypothetical protein
MRTARPTLRPLPTGLVLVATAVATAIALYAADVNASGFSWMVVALVAGFSLSGSV